MWHEDSIVNSYLYIQTQFLRCTKYCKLWIAVCDVQGDSPIMITPLIINYDIWNF